MRKSFVYGHPDLIKQVPIYSKSEIKNFSQKEIHHIIPWMDKKKHKRKQSKFEENYEVIELAPNLFKNIRKLNKVDDSMIWKIFCMAHIEHVDIKISTGKGGAFFIEPTDGGWLMIKSITKPEFEII